MRFSEVTSITVPEGGVTKITAPNGVLWESANSGGGTGGGTSKTYSGSTVANGVTTLECIATELNGASDPAENLGHGINFDCNIGYITATLVGTNEEDNVVSKIQNGVVTYYDVTIADYVTTTYEVDPYQHPGTGYITGIRLRVAKEAEDSTWVKFSGTYNWSFTESAK